MISQGKKLYCSFIGFSKAFDYVERNTLWVKLIKLGIRVDSIEKYVFACKVTCSF